MLVWNALSILLWRAESFIELEVFVYNPIFVQFVCVEIVKMVKIELIWMRW